MVPSYCRSARLDLALLHYFSGNYDDAWIELGILLEEQGRFDTREQQLQEQQEQGRFDKGRFDTRQEQQEQQAASSRQQQQQQECEAASNRQRREEPSLSCQEEDVRVGHNLEDRDIPAERLQAQAQVSPGVGGPAVANHMSSSTEDAPSSWFGREEACDAAAQGADVGADADAEGGAEKDPSCGPESADSLELAVDLGLSSEHPAWDPLSEDQVLQARVLQEKLRLLLSV